MRLVSKFHDYYDGVFRSSLVDKSRTFVRETKDIIIQSKDIHFLNFSCDCGKHTFNFKSGIIGFCGNIYPYIKRTTAYTWNDSFDVDPKKEYYYTMEDFLNKNKIIRDGKSKLERWSNVHKLEDIKNWFEGVVRGWGWEFRVTSHKPFWEIFLKHKIAYFVVDVYRPLEKDVKIIVYPNLKNYQFYKVFDVHGTFQQIDMYLNNELVPHDDRKVIIPDKLKAETHGFDKWSFRKEPTKKKK